MTASWPDLRNLCYWCEVKMNRKKKKLKKFEQWKSQEFNFLSGICYVFFLLTSKHMDVVFSRWHSNLALSSRFTCNKCNCLSIFYHHHPTVMRSKVRSTGYIHMPPSAKCQCHGAVRGAAVALNLDPGTVGCLWCEWSSDVFKSCFEIWC